MSQQEQTSDPFTIADPNLTIELVASSRDIQTPIGLAIDHQDDLYVLESHTHTPLDDYQGPDHDRIKKGIDHNNDGIPDNWIIYADSLEDGMNLVFGNDRTLYVTTKNAVWAFYDKNDDGVSEFRQQILRMTIPESVYDHGAILGVAVSPDNHWLFVSRGNTAGEHWEIVGTDGLSINGYGDGGNIMRCRLDGSELEEVATGFWNPFDIKFTVDGRLMATDNDPDSRGPNRLVEIVPGGDYGYKSLYGGSGIHPFVAWNGELPGTLPYAAPLGEAPCALLDGSLTGFGDDYKDNILVNVWEEKNIVKIPLREWGSSVRGEPQVLVQGDSAFHPVAMVANSKGEVYITDWVVRQYPNHGKGKIWRLRSKEATTKGPQTSLDHYRFTNNPLTSDEIKDNLISSDPFLKSESRLELQQSGDYGELLSLLSNGDAELRLQSLLVLCKRSEKLTEAKLVELLSDADKRIQKMALYYIGTRQVQEMQELLNASMHNGKITPELFETYLATIQNLNPEFIEGYRQKSQKRSYDLNRELPDNFVENIIENSHIDESIRSLALPYLGKPQEHINLLTELLQSAKEDPFRLSLIASITKAVPQAGKTQAIGQLLLQVAADSDNSERVRASAIAALPVGFATQCGELYGLLSSASPVIQYAAIKQLCRYTGAKDVNRVDQWIDENKAQINSTVASVWMKHRAKEYAVSSTEQWIDAVNGNGSPLRGELVFKWPSSQCMVCHKVNGWGGIFGPDLSGIGNSKGQIQLINAILHPTMEMAPEWQGWYVIDQQGNKHLGRQIDVHLNRVELMNINGSFDTYHQPRSYGVSTESVMPEGLQNQMTLEEFNDLIAYLVSLK